MEELLLSDNLTEEVYKRIINGTAKNEDLIALSVWYDDLIRLMKSDDFAKRMIQGFSLSKRKKMLMAEISPDKNHEEVDQKFIDFFSHSLTEEDRKNVENLPAKLREIYENMTKLVNLSKVNNMGIQCVLLGDKYSKYENQTMNLEVPLPLPEEGYINIARNVINQANVPTFNFDLNPQIALLVANKNVPPLVLRELTIFLNRVIGATTKQDSDYQYRNGMRELQQIAEHPNTPISSLGEMFKKRYEETLCQDTLYEKLLNRLCNEYGFRNTRQHQNYAKEKCLEDAKQQDNAIYYGKTVVKDSASKLMSEEHLSEFNDMVTGVFLENNDPRSIRKKRERIESAITAMYKSIATGNEPEKSDDELTNSLIEYMTESNKRKALILCEEKIEYQSFFERLKAKVSGLLKKIRINARKRRINIKTY